VLTLVVVPVIYTLMEAISQFGVRMAGWFGGGKHSEPAARPSVSPIAED
jgi:hypothetical protein